MTTLEFNAKYQPLKDLLFAFAMKLTRNQFDAQDLMQETLCRAFKNKDRFTLGTNFKAWITTIMRNNFINDYRKMKTRNRVEAPIEDFGYFVENKSVEGNANSLIMMKELTNILNNLSEDFRKPFIMFVIKYYCKHLTVIIWIIFSQIRNR